MKNFVKLTEVQVDNNKKTKFFNNFIRPSEIVLLEQMIFEGNQVTKIHFAIGGNKCSFFAKETPDEIDDIINNFYEGKKGKPSVKSSNRPKTMTGRSQ